MHKSTQGMKTFFIIWLGQLGSMIGSGLIGFALAVWIFEQTGQATPFALTGLFAILPRVILSPVAGALSDRWNRKKIMLISDSLSGVITFATAVRADGSLDGLPDQLSGVDFCCISTAGVFGVNCDAGAKRPAFAG